jgi:hypothetical protein
MLERHAEILRTNVSFFNIILFVIGAALTAMSRYSDALVSVGLGLINAVISAAQEIRAKRKLDRLQLLDRADVLVVRDGREVTVPTRGPWRRSRPGPARTPANRWPARPSTAWAARSPGLTYGSDTDFTAAAATIGADRPVHVLLLRHVRADPVPRATEPLLRGVDGAERRPAATALVGILVVAFGAVLSVPALYTYFGLAGPSRPPFVIVLFALTLWFATLSLDRVLGLDELRAIR